MFVLPKIFLCRLFLDNILANKEYLFLVIYCYNKYVVVKVLLLTSTISAFCGSAWV